MGPSVSVGRMHPPMSSHVCSEILSGMIRVLLCFMEEEDYVLRPEWLQDSSGHQSRLHMFVRQTTTNPK